MASQTQAPCISTDDLRDTVIMLTYSQLPVQTQLSDPLQSDNHNSIRLTRLTPPHHAHHGRYSRSPLLLSHHHSKPAPAVRRSRDDGCLLAISRRTSQLQPLTALPAHASKIYSHLQPPTPIKSSRSKEFVTPPATKAVNSHGKPSTAINPLFNELETPISWPLALHPTWILLRSYLL